MARAHCARRGQEQGDDRAQLSAALAALGVASGATDTLDDRTHETLVCLWRKLGRMPTEPELAMAIGSPRTSINSAMRRLVDCGRALRPRRGIIVPVL